MIRLILSLLLISLTPLIAANTETEAGLPTTNACRIKVSVAGFEGGECKFLGVNGKQNFLALPAMNIEGEEILISREEKFPGGLYYLLFPNQQHIQMLLDADQKFTLQTKLDDLVQSMQVTGSLDNQLLYRNLRYEETYRSAFEALTEQIKKAKDTGGDHEVLEKERDALVDKRQVHINEFATNHPDSFFTVFKLAGQNPKLEHPKLPNGEIDTEKQLELYRAKFWDNVDFTDARLLRTPVFHNKLERFIKKLTPQRVDAVIASADAITTKTLGNKELFHYVTSYICLAYQKSSMMGGEAVYVHMADNYLTHELAASIGAEELKKARQQANRFRPSLLGKTGQDIRARNPEDEYESLYDITAPITVLYIFNVDCEHCQEQTPQLLEVYEDWKDRGVDVFALCTNQDIEQWRQYVREQNLPWHNVIDPKYESRYHAKYNVDITPEIYVLNADKEIVGMNLKAHQLEWLFNKEFSK